MKFTYLKHLLRSGLPAFLLISISISKLFAQEKTSFTNDWVRHGQSYVKISVSQKGIYRIDPSALPENFPKDSPEKFQLWRRGQQVSIISATSNEILFYGVPNDGARDSLLYKPFSDRKNPYNSLFSDESAYFLTVGSEAGKRAKIIDEKPNQAVKSLAYHKEIAVTLFKDEYSLSLDYPVRKSIYNSYYEKGASATGISVSAGKELSHPFQLKNTVDGTSKQIIMKLLINGRSNNSRTTEIYVGRTAASQRLVKSVNSTGFGATEFSFELKPEDLDTERGGVLSLKSGSTENSERFSLAYFTLEYAQSFHMAKDKIKAFRLDATNDPWSRIAVPDAPSGTLFLDVTDRDNPLLIKGSPANLMVPRQKGREQILIAISDISGVKPEKTTAVTFIPYQLAAHDYIIITSDSLISGAQQYADYRASKAGGGYKPLVVDIRQLYDQFNYGEPSPLAIKQFMSYILTDGGKDKYLFLIGRSTMRPEYMKRELTGDVPSIGYPGSDMLLVEGIGGAKPGYPAVPVGRLAALNAKNVTDYLDKVKSYESNMAGDLQWRKNVLHLSGGKNEAEITSLKSILASLEPVVNKGVIGGKVIQLFKRQPMVEVEQINIATEINNGIGLLSFFGHGSTIESDPDIGYASDVPRTYQNLHKYPLMYFNGCGVGNIFAGRSNQFPKHPRANDRITLSQDWLITPKKGAVAVIASSFESIVTPSAHYLQKLYHFMFADTATATRPIGNIQYAVTNDILLHQNDEYSIANVHQSILQGDPALRLISVAKPDYAIDPDLGITLFSKSSELDFKSSDSIRIRLTLNNHGRFEASRQVAIHVTVSGEKYNKVLPVQIKAFATNDTVTITIPNTNDLNSIQVEIDPAHLIAELDEHNNTAELMVDWPLIRDAFSFTSGNIKDIVPPVMTVRFNDRLIRQDERLLPNPALTIHLTDDRQLFPDTSLVDIFIKPCGNAYCDFQKISFANGDLRLEADGNKAFRILYKTKLTSGTYELLINARDRAANITPDPYRIRFEVVTQETEPIKLVVSPNPFTSYIRFALKTPGSQIPTSITYQIFNLTGNLLDERQVPPFQGNIAEWYWFPGDNPDQQYIYKVKWKDIFENKIRTLTGQVVRLH